MRSQTRVATVVHVRWYFLVPLYTICCWFGFVLHSFKWTGKNMGRHNEIIFAILKQTLSAFSHHTDTLFWHATYEFNHTGWRIWRIQIKPCFDVENGFWTHTTRHSFRLPITVTHCDIQWKSVSLTNPCKFHLKMSSSSHDKCPNKNSNDCWTY